MRHGRHNGRADLELFKLFGIGVRVHFSWWFIFILLSWSLSTSYFPLFYPGLSHFQYWIIGLISAFLLFFSVLLHEFSHSLIAKHNDIKVESITLFFFGGVSGITKEDISPKKEFAMAFAGPLFSLVLAAIFFGIFFLSKGLSGIYINSISFYLFQLNIILAIFNLVPAYPLDGGRMFRAILHHYLHDLRKATKIAAIGGKTFAWFLAILGVLQIINGNYGGLWLVFLGIFLHFIAGLSYEQVVFRHVLGQWDVKEFMKKKFTTVNATQTFSTFVKKQKGSGVFSFLVKKGKKVIGVLNLNQLGKLAPDVQERMTVEQVMFPIAKIPMLHPEDNGYKAFRLFSQTPHTLLPIRDAKGKVIAILEREKLMQALLWHLNYGAMYGKEK
jgi:Zn-dependent protease